ALAAQSFQAGQLLLQMVDTSAECVLVRPGMREINLSKAFANEFHSRFKALFQLGRIEHDKGDLFPVIALVLSADDADGPLEPLAVQPQLAVERFARQPLDEPVRCVKDVALPRQKLLAG